MTLRFHKMHGAGNDFMLVDLRAGAQSGPLPEIDSDTARAWGDRRTGVGFDQLLVLGEADSAGVDAKVAIWNADGSPAEQCGNGMRAIGLFLARLDRQDRDRFRVDTPAGAIALRWHGADRTATETEVSVAMGAPRWAPEDVPIAGLTPSDDHAYRLDLGGENVRFGALSMGNPHTVIEVPAIETAPLDSVGQALRSHPAFPASCNVGFAEVVAPNHIRLRVLERGAGETRACGSGACAAVAWLTRRGRVTGRVRVEQGGGTLWVETGEGLGPVSLAGPAVYVFEGTLA